MAAVPQLVENREAWAEQVPELKSLLLHLTETMQHLALLEFLLEVELELERIAKALEAGEDEEHIHARLSQVSQTLAAEAEAARQQVVQES